jgi:predicted nucleic acid-binding protein
VLNEFFSIALRKLHMTPVAARLRTVDFVDTWRVLDITTQIVVNAARGVVEHQLNYWHAPLWATARVNNIPHILSEDFQDGIRIEGVLVLNPFHPDFDIDRLLKP